MNPSQEPAQPQHPRQPPADPTAAGPTFGAPEYEAFGAEAARPQVTPDGGGSSAGPSRTPGARGGPGAGGSPGWGDSPGAGGTPGWGDSPGAGGTPGWGGGPGGNGSWAGDGAAAQAGEPGSGADHGGFGLAHPSGPGAEDVGGSPAGAWWSGQRSVRRAWKRTAAVAALSGVVVFALGGPLGLLWAWLAPDVPVIDAGQSGIVVNDPSPEEYIAADGWFTLLGLGFGLLVAIVAWLLLRRDRGPFLLLGVVAGTLGAGYLVAPWVGEMIGRGAYEHWRDTAAQGATYMAPPEIHSTGPMLVPAFAAAIVLTLLAGWSNDPDLEQPGAKPGYGPNTASGEAGLALAPSAEWSGQEQLSRDPAARADLRQE